MFIALAIGFVFFAGSVHAQTARDEVCKVSLSDPGASFDVAAGKCVDSNGNSPEGLFEGPFKAITNTLIFITGAISILMLVIGGLRYTVSGGDANAVSGAKNTIIYAIVGLIISIFAFSIVNFILGRI